MKTTGIGRMLIACSAAGVLIGLSLTSPVLATQPAATAKAKPEKAKDDGVRDKLIFRSGREVTGKIVEETETTVKMLVIVAGITSSEATAYAKSDILSIERGSKPDEKAAEAAKKEAEKKAADEKAKGGDKKGVTGAIKEGAAKIYMIELTGEFGRDVSATPLRAVMKDVKKYQPDILLVKMDTDFKINGDEKEAFEPGALQGAFDQQLETARQVQTIITDEVRDDPEWKTKPRMVCWVKRALGGAAFLPFVFPEIYYTGDGMHGGIGYLDHLFDGVGDKVVQRKQQSLRLGRAEGLANKGGHDTRILKAMAMVEYVLSVKYEGGKPILIEGMPIGPDEELLTDDGIEQTGHMDTMQDAVRLKGNDFLNLTAELAYKLGVSAGTADTQDDLIFKLGVSRNFGLVQGRAKDLLAEWSKSIDDAERGFIRKFREQQDLTVDAPGGVPERQRYLGTRIRLLTECKELLERYKEAMDPRKIRGSPEQWITRINEMIEQLKQQLRLMPKR